MSMSTAAIVDADSPAADCAEVVVGAEVVAGAEVEDDGALELVLDELASVGAAASVGGGAGFTAIARVDAGGDGGGATAEELEAILIAGQAWNAPIGQKQAQAPQDGDASGAVLAAATTTGTDGEPVAVVILSDGAAGTTSTTTLETVVVDVPGEVGGGKDDAIGATSAMDDMIGAWELY